MRSRASRAALVALLVAGCATPIGAPVEECGPDWEPQLTDVPRNFAAGSRSVPIECYRVTAEQRIEVGFLMPPGPDCYAIDVVDVVESDEAVSVLVRVGPVRDPFGACPREEIRWGVLLELNRPVEGREVLDASVPTN